MDRSCLELRIPEPDLPREANQGDLALSITLRVRLHVVLEIRIYMTLKRTDHGSHVGKP